LNKEYTVIDEQKEILERVRRNTNSPTE